MTLLCWEICQRYQRRTLQNIGNWYPHPLNQSQTIKVLEVSTLLLHAQLNKITLAYHSDFVDFALCSLLFFFVNLIDIFQSYMYIRWSIFVFLQNKNKLHACLSQGESGFEIVLEPLLAQLPKVYYHPK